MASSSDPCLRFRSEFPILERCTYLVSHSLGAMPRGAREGLLQYSHEWDERGVRAWNDAWWELPVVLGDTVGALLGAPARSIAMQPNVTLAAAIFLSACDFSGTRNRIVTTALEFPSVLYCLDGFRAVGAEIVTIPSEDGLTIDLDRLCAAIDQQTRVVVLSHVLFRSSFLQDIDAIATRAQQVGAWILLDVYQSAGTVPLDLTRLGIEAAAGGCLKWLCGGPGAAFLYVRPDLARQLQPRLTGWQAHVDPFDFAAPPLVPAEGAWRFLHGTPGIPALRAAEVGLRIVGEADVSAIRAKSLRQTETILERCLQAGWTMRTPREPERRGGTVSIDPPHAYEASRALLERGVIIDYRPGAGIRMAPHFYNTDEEVEVALDTLAEVLADGTWRRFADRERDRVT